MALKTFGKDPDAIKPYTLNWTAFLDGDTITSSVWTLDSGITSSSETNTTKKTTIFLSGGTVGTTYTATNRITTTNGITEDQSIQITIASN